MPILLGRRGGASKTGGEKVEESGARRQGAPCEMTFTAFSSHHKLLRVQITLHVDRFNWPPPSTPTPTRATEKMRTKRAADHCPRGHAWKLDCFSRNHCGFCPKRPGKGVLPRNGICPSCRAEEEEPAKREAKKSRNQGQGGRERHAK
jgi:hypothetical protein